MVYVGPAGPVWLVSAPVSVIAAAPVLRHVGATTTVSLGWYTPLPAESTTRACGATDWVGTVLHAPGKRYVMSSIQTPMSATELSDANRKRIFTSRPEKSAMSTRTSWKVKAWLPTTPAVRRAGSGTPC